MDLLTKLFGFCRVKKLELQKKLKLMRFGFEKSLRNRIILGERFYFIRVVRLCPSDCE